MTSPRERPNTALLVIDVQNDVVATAHQRDAVVEAINEVVSKARAANAPVVWVQHDDDLPAGTEGWEIVPELEPRADELVVFKNFRDAFEATTLDDELADRGVGKLVVTGAQSDFFVRCTVRSAAATKPCWLPMRTRPTRNPLQAGRAPRSSSTQTPYGSHSRRRAAPVRS